MSNQNHEKNEVVKKNGRREIYVSPRNEATLRGAEKKCFKLQISFPDYIFSLIKKDLENGKD